jgi:hypothetical protein
MATTQLPDGTQLSTINLAALQAITERCFELSMDGAIPAEQQAQYNALGNKLTADLNTLTSAYFSAATQQFATANQQLAAVNTMLSQAAATVAGIATAITALGQLAITLDSLLSVAAKFA